MPADDDDFVGFLAPPDFSDDVGGRRVGLEMRVHPQTHDDAAAAVGHALQQIGVLGRNRRRRNLRGVGRVLQRARVRRAQPRRSDGTDQHGHGAVSSGARRALRTVPNRFAIIRVGHVEQDDAAAHAVGL